ncbi:MAG TPA: hypothetical protein VK787_07970, partial [Puia sp.]|nr:hypothetical protein [Puia sp.]
MIKSKRGMAITNKKSDIKAKNAYKEHLEISGYSNVQIIASPADIKAIKDNKTYFFEIKMTKQSENYFG